MKHKVLKKQNNSKSCIVCGLENDFGIKASFYEIDNGELVAVCICKNHHQSYPGRLHGGVSAALLDETIGRAINITNPDLWGVTIELNTKYRKPVPLGEELKVVGRITKETHRGFEGTGEIILKNGDIAVTAHGRYIKLTLDKITESDFISDEWVTVENEDDPKEIIL